MSDLTMCRLGASAQPSSQSTMLTILWILVSFALPVLGPHIPVSCPEAKECFLALISNNDVLLECTISDTHWLFSGRDGDGKPIDLSGVSNIRKSPEGGLHIQNPLPTNTGLYQCLDKNGTQVTSYKIDFQNIARLHTTHKNLNQEPLMNETLNLGHREVVYTQWGPWQRCNNCDRQGERKRLGYCYIKEPLEEPVPCGLYLGGTNVFYTRVRPEMQVEICHEECQSHLMGGDYVIFDNFRYTEEELGSVWLTCPFASIYRPVHWEADNSPLTWQNQLSDQEISAIMDLHSGGRHLKVFQPATYRCFVEQELIAQFNPTPSASVLEAERQSKAQEFWQSQIQPGKADFVLRGLKLLLLTVSVLAVGGLLCKVVFHHACGKKRNQVLLVK